MTSTQEDYPFDRFTPDLRRFVVAETWILALSLGALAGIGYLLGSDTRYTVVVALVLGLVVIGFKATVGRRSRRIIIGDTWIEGPSRLGGGSATVQFNMIDWAASGICRGRLRIRSQGSDTVEARTGWYTPEDLEEMKRIIRDRSGGRELSVRLTWLTRLSGDQNRGIS